EKAQGSYHSSGVPSCCPAATPGQPAVTPCVGLLLKPGFKLGRSGAHLSPFREILDPTRAVNGSPVRKVPIPFTVQPPAISSRALCWKRKGKGYVMVGTTLCLASNE